MGIAVPVIEKPNIEVDDEDNMKSFSSANPPYASTIVTPLISN